HDRKAESSDEYYKDVWVIIAFCVLVMFRTAPQVASMTFLPKLFYDRGYDPGAYGIVTTVFMGGTAIGGLIGGFMSDRWGRRRIIQLSLLAAVIPMYYYPVAQGLAVYTLVFLAGFFNGGSHAVIVVIAQSLLPNRRALASGLTMGFMFASGALGSYLIGLAADYYSLVNAMQTNGLLCLLAAGLSLVLRRDDKKTLKASI
ncbi:MAG: MFS transporter, partial [Anaerolineales bacterium]|nr:MFS transporter [Anaerolineales bacterium]